MTNRMYALVGAPYSRRRRDLAARPHRPRTPSHSICHPLLRFAASCFQLCDISRFTACLDAFRFCAIYRSFPWLYEAPFYKQTFVREGRSLHTSEPPTL